MKLTKEQYDALPDFAKALYAADGDGYSPTFKTAEEVKTELAGLKANNDKLLGEKKAEKEARAAAEKAAKEAAEEAARKNGDVAALDKSWQDKFTAYDNENKGRTEAYRKQIADLTVGSAANDLAAKLFGKNAGIMKGHVANRLTLEEGEDGSLKVRVLKDGKPSAATLEDLEKEFRSNADFASVLAGTPAGGTPKTPTQEVGKDKPSISMTHAFGITDMKSQAAKIIDAMPDVE